MDEKKEMYFGKAMYAARKFNESIANATTPTKKKEKTMKRIIAGRIYDTDTARIIASRRDVSDEGPTYYVSYYRTRSGRFFVHEECGHNEHIEPVSEEAVKEFCSAHPECIDDEKFGR